MTAENFRKLKHELRTPVNHILGYGELVREAASDAGEEAMVMMAEQVQQGGRLLAKLLEEGLLSGGEEMDTRLEGLSRKLRPVIQQILIAATPSPEPAGFCSYAADLQKICRAARELEALLTPKALANEQQS